MTGDVTAATDAAITMADSIPSPAVLAWSQASIPNDEADRNRVEYAAYTRGFVVIVGLKARDDLNDCEGQITGDMQNGRYPVAIRRGARVETTRVLIRPENLEPWRSPFGRSDHSQPRAHPPSTAAPMSSAPPLWDEGLLPDGSNASKASSELFGYRGQHHKIYFFGSHEKNLDQDGVLIGCCSGGPNACQSRTCLKVEIHIPYVAYAILCCDVVLLRAVFRAGAGKLAHVSTPVQLPEVHFGGSRDGLRDPSLRFRLGDQVLCFANEGWRPGRIVKLWHQEMDGSDRHPYQIQLTDGGPNDLIYAPSDTDVSAYGTPPTLILRVFF